MTLPEQIVYRMTDDRIRRELAFDDAFDLDDDGGEKWQRLLLDEICRRAEMRR